MGSIVAILPTAPTGTDLARKMLAAAPHQGPDFSVKACGACILGVSSRKGFVDATISADADLIAGFTGKLNNASELLESLNSLGFPPAGTTPADILVSAFRAFGPSAPSRLRGAFAAVVTNGRDLWCFRDHLGFRPLFFRDDRSGFFVGSEAKQIIAGTGLTKQPDLGVLELLFYGRFTQETPSALKGIERLPHCTLLTVNQSGVSKPQRYWNPAPLLETARFSPDEIGERFSHVFEQAVARTLTGQDVISLSGGIDSPAVAAYASPLYQKLMGRHISALSNVFPQHPAVDESSYIELISKYLNIDLHTYTPHAKPWEDLLSWCALFDGPIPTISLPDMAEYYGMAHQLGFRNVLRGDIAEVVFNLQRHVVGHLLSHGRWKPLLNTLKTLRRQGKSWRTLAGYSFSPLVPGWLANKYLHFRGQDFPSRIPDWVDVHKVNQVPFRQDLMPPGHKRWISLQLEPLRGHSLMLESDTVCAALNGVTVERPFADIDLWEFFLSLPAELKHPDLRAKTLMRRLLRGRLPDEILDRRDKTFFDDYIMSMIDYEPLRRFLLNPAYRMPGVKYDILADRIHRQDMKLVDYFWVNDLVRIHAFLSQW
jgi:asparagine synthase (glutamine-hydrolysing)